MPSATRGSGAHRARHLALVLHIALSHGKGQSAQPENRILPKILKQLNGGGAPWIFEPGYRLGLMHAGEGCPPQMPLERFGLHYAEYVVPALE